MRTGIGVGVGYGRPASGGMTLPQTESIYAWIDASQETLFTNGQSLPAGTSVSDHSGSGRNWAIKQSTAQFITTGFGGSKSVYSVPNTSHVGYSTGGTDDPDYSECTVVVVVYGLGTPTYEIIFGDSYRNAGEHGVYAYKDNNVLVDWDSTNVIPKTPQTINGTTPYIFVLTNSTTGSTTSIRVNGAELATGNGDSSTPDTDAAVAFLLGWSSSAGQLGEGIMWSGTTLSGTEITDLESSLADKWGVTLA